MVEGMVVAVANGTKVEAAPAAGAGAAANADSPTSVLEDEISECKNGDASDTVEAIKQEDDHLKVLAEERADDFVDASSSLTVELAANNGDLSPHPVPVKEEDQLLEPVKEEKADDFVDATSSLPIDLEAKNGDASLITDAMKEEEDKLHEARVKADEEEEARKRAEAARLAFDPNARFNKLDELLTQTQLYSEFLLEKMETIADVEGVDTPDEGEPVEEKKKGRGRKRKATSAPKYNNKKAKKAVAAMLTRSREDCSPEDCTLTEEERMGLMGYWLIKWALGKQYRLSVFLPISRGRVLMVHT